MGRYIGYVTTVAIVSLALLMSSPGGALAQAGQTGQAVLAWNASSNSSVTGYNVYVGTQSGDYQSPVSAGNSTTYTVTGLSASQTYYFNVTAYSASTESPFTTEVVCDFITADPPSNGQITPAGVTAVAGGGSQTYTIVPDPGYQIATVTVDGQQVANPTSSYTFSSVSGCHVIAATFAPGSYTITASSQAGGTISPSGAVSVSGGSNQVFTISPASNYTISGVQVDGASVGAVSSYTFSSVAANHTISASFTAVSPVTYTITASAGSNGSISPSGADSVASGSSPTFTITPSSGYQVAAVMVDGTSVGAVSTYKFSDVAANHTISATFSQITYTITASAGANGSISPSGADSVASGSSPTFTITPSSGYQVAAVMVDGTSVGAVSTYKFSDVAANHTISATFSQITYTITASAGANGSISPSGADSVASGSSPTFTITPSSGYQVAAVTVDGTSVGAVSTYKFSDVAANHTISATFSQITYTITASAGANGSISPSGADSVASGSSPTFTITPSSGYQVAAVTVDGTSVGAVSSYSFSSVAANHTISATFTAITYTITASAGANGSISPSGADSVASGSSPTFTITPSSGYQVAAVTVDGTSVGAVSSYSFSSVAANHTISATFSQITYTITASAGANGSISPSGADSVASGSSPTFTITPSSGYQVAAVTVDGTSVGAVSSYSFSSVAANHTISATFTAASYSISATFQGSGSISPSGTIGVSSGSSSQFTITPDTGYQISNVEVDGASVGAVSSYTFTHVSANHSIQATFTAQQCSISASVQGDGGTISPSGTNTVSAGTNVSYSMTPAAGYTVTSVLVDGNQVASAQLQTSASTAAVGAKASTSATTYTFTNVEGNHTICVVFSPASPLVADPGPDQQVQSGSTVSLNGSNSTGSPCPIASFEWSQVSGPTVSLSNPSSPQCTFSTRNIASTAALAFNLTVTNAEGASSSALCLVDVSPSGAGPSVNAGPDRTVSPSSNVTLDGSSSSDNYGALTSYTWTQIAGPTVSILNADTPVASFVAPTPGSDGATLVFELSVQDQYGLEARGQWTVNVVSDYQPPVANAGSGITAAPLTTVRLSGTGSSDPAGSSDTYRWTQISGVPVTLSNPTSPTPFFTAPISARDQESQPVFMLTVTDTMDQLSSTAECTVTVTNANPNLPSLGPKW